MIGPSFGWWTSSTIVSSLPLFRSLFDLMFHLCKLALHYCAMVVGLRSIIHGIMQNFKLHHPRSTSIKWLVHVLKVKVI
nr:hypothetical protein [Tanacetum cinerariifolium]